MKYNDTEITLDEGLRQLLIDSLMTKTYMAGHAAGKYGIADGLMYIAGAIGNLAEAIRETYSKEEVVDGSGRTDRHPPRVSD